MTAKTRWMEECRWCCGCNFKTSSDMNQ